MTSLTFEVDFSPADHGSPEERATTADLRITANDEVLTRVDDSWAKSVRERIRVSCYPMATWVASSWWRLLHEPPSIQFEQSMDWRMSHLLSAAGGGFLWPRVSFVPDGEGIDVVCHPSPRVLAEPLRFLTSYRGRASVVEAERALGDFVTSVVARLDALGLSRTELHELWSDVTAERADPIAARFRRLEAELGFDADEGPEELMATLSGLESRAGRLAVEEIATAAGGARPRRPNPSEFVREVEHLVTAPGMKAEASPALGLRPGTEKPRRPWERGWGMASQLRATLGVPKGPITDEVLRSLLGGDFTQPMSAGPIGLAVRSGRRGAIIHFRRTNPLGRRFEAARFVAELALAPAEEAWLPTTDAATARQKAQRAFAAEFLAPIADLQSRLDGDFSQDGIDSVADEYRVSPLTISSHLANNGLIEPDDVKSAGRGA